MGIRVHNQVQYRSVEHVGEAFGRALGHIFNGVKRFFKVFADLARYIINFGAKDITKHVNREVKTPIQGKLEPWEGIKQSHAYFVDLLNKENDFKLFMQDVEFVKEPQLSLEDFERGAVKVKGLSEEEFLDPWKEANVKGAFQNFLQRHQLPDNIPEPVTKAVKRVQETANKVSGVVAEKLKNQENHEKLVGWAEDLIQQEYRAFTHGKVSSGATLVVVNKAFNKALSVVPGFNFVPESIRQMLLNKLLDRPEIREAIETVYLQLGEERLVEYFQSLAGKIYTKAKNSTILFSIKKLNNVATWVGNISDSWIREQDNAFRWALYRVKKLGVRVARSKFPETVRQTIAKVEGVVKETFSTMEVRKNVIEALMPVTGYWALIQTLVEMGDELNSAQKKALRARLKELGIQEIGAFEDADVKGLADDLAKLLLIDRRGLGEAFGKVADKYAAKIKKEGTRRHFERHMRALFRKFVVRHDEMAKQVEDMHNQANVQLSHIEKGKLLTNITKIAVRYGMTAIGFSSPVAMAVAYGVPLGKKLWNLNCMKDARRKLGHKVVYLVDHAEEKIESAKQQVEARVGYYVIEKAAALENTKAGKVAMTVANFVGPKMDTISSAISKITDPVKEKAQEVSDLLAYGTARLIVAGGEKATEAVAKVARVATPVINSAKAISLKVATSVMAKTLLVTKAAVPVIKSWAAQSQQAIRKVVEVAPPVIQAAKKNVEEVAGATTWRTAIGVGQMFTKVKSWGGKLVGLLPSYEGTQFDL